MRCLLLIISFLLISFQSFSQVRINEFSSLNLNGITDEDGDHTDWIELFNNTGSEINLDGFHLSDNANFLKKWTFPPITMKPDSYQLIFASGKNRAEIPVSYHTIISRGDDWQYLVPSAEIGNSWMNSSFDASAWNTGPSGFGYGDNDDSTVLNNIVSVFIRKEFTIKDLQNIQELILSIDYDDGFIAYINGHEIARSNLGTVGSVVSYNQLTGSLAREATMYQGGFPENFHVENPGSFLTEGVNVIAIEGHNSDPGSSDFTLIPILCFGLKSGGYTDSIPDYVQIKGRQLHTDFKIKNEGESLFLSRPDSSIFDSIAPIALPADVSFGRVPDGADSWFYFSDPTPDKANKTSGYKTLYGDTVQFSHIGGYIPGGLELQLSSVNSSDSIFFTLDGSEPSSDDSLYSTPIIIEKNSIVRARSVKYNKPPGLISTNTYITKHHTLPVICLSTDPANLWDFNTGIYVLGPNASIDFPYFGANFWQDWEKRAHMEFYDVNGNKQIDQDIGLKIFGSWSRANSQKSMSLFARREYGKGSFDYQFFKDKPINKFESVILRNGGNDWNQGILRDGLTSTIVRDMDIDRMAFQPTIVYLNGEYWGILNLREKISSNYLAENHFVNPESVNLLESPGSPGIIIEGTNTSYNEMITFIDQNSLVSEQNYLQVSKKIDLDNYIQYQLTEIYINNKDWPGNNIRYWNTNDSESKWRWIIYDTDFGFSIWESTAYTFNTLQWALDPAGNYSPWATLLFRRMMSNPGFKNNFINQYADRLNTNFTYLKVNATIDSLVKIYLPEIEDHLTRWNLNYDTWQYNISIIKEFAKYRPNYARGNMQSVLNLGSQLSINVDIEVPGTGNVKVNSVIPDRYPFTGIYFRSVPIKLFAIPATGYKLSRWEVGKMNSTSLILDYDMVAPNTFKAVFEPAESADNKIVINEINYNSSPDKDTKDWVELYNSGKSTVNLKGWIISDGAPDSGYIFPSDIILSPGEYTVVCREISAFKKFFPRILNVTGDLNFGLSSSGDDVNLYDEEGNLIDYVRFTPEYPWPVETESSGASIELVNPEEDNSLGKNWKSGISGGTPGTLNIRTTPYINKDENLASECNFSCFPNPFQSFTTIRIEITVSGKYKLEVYNLQGKLVRILSDQNIGTGAYYFDWDGRDSNSGVLPQGIYLVRLTGEKQNCNLKIVKVR
jgi:hypothetical protein